ncbi:MAG: peptidylprolyl isomerase [Tuberibacillus sp.]
MKKWIAAAAVAFGLISVSACGTNGAVVNTDAGKISQEDFYNKLKDQAGDQVLQNMVYEKLLSKKYKVTDKEINDKIKELMAQNKITSQDQLKAVLAQNGQTLESLKDNVKLNLLIFKATTAGVKVSDKEMQDYFNKNKDTLVEVKASHILVKDEKTANEVEQKIKNGEDFAKLAETYSTDEGTKTKGGDLGWFHKGDMVQQFESKAFSMKPGEISEPVKSDYGYHIIKLVDKKDTLNDFKSQVKEAVLQSKAKDAQTVLDKLVKDNHVKVNDKDLKDVFSTSSGSSK